MLIFALLNSGGVPTFEVGQFKVSPIGFFLPKLEYNADAKAGDFYVRFARLVLVTKTEDVQAIVQFHGDNWGKAGSAPQVIVGRAFVNVSRFPVKVRFGRYILPFSRECTPPSKWMLPELSFLTKRAVADKAAFLSEGLMLHGPAGPLYYAISVSDGTEADSIKWGPLFLGRFNWALVGTPEGIDGWTFYRFKEESLVDFGLGFYYEPVDTSWTKLGLAFDAHAEMGRFSGSLLYGMAKETFGDATTSSMGVGAELFGFFGDLDEKAGPGVALKVDYKEPNTGVEDDEVLNLHLGGLWFFKGGAERAGLYVTRSAPLAGGDQSILVSLLYHLVI